MVQKLSEKRLRKQVRLDAIKIVAKSDKTDLQ